MKILHLEKDCYSDTALARLEQRHEIHFFNCADQEMLRDKISRESYQIIFTRLGLMLGKEEIDQQAELRYIVTPTTGLNHINTAYAADRGIQIISLKGEFEFLSSIKSTAEHTWGLLLALIRNIPAAHQSVLAGGWDRKPFLSDELDGKVLGIVGYGRLGKIVGEYASAFGMRVMVHDCELVQGRPHVEVVDEQTVLSTADFLLLLISYSDQNRLFMNNERFTQMKRGSYFVNTSRGELVDEQALLSALKSGQLKGAALDVLDGDSSWSDRVEASDELVSYARQQNNLILTPHMGGYGKESIMRTRDFVVEKILQKISHLS